MGIAHLLFSSARRTFAGLSCTTTAVLDVNEGKLAIQNATTEVSYVAASVEDDVERTGRREEELADDHLAAIVIQAYFRGHLARRAYRALRSLVKVQAVVRGVRARRQAQLAVHCMEALVRLQVRVRARQLLSRSGQEENLK